MKNLAFVQAFMRFAQDAWLKGWHERNGGNYSYRLREEEVVQALPYTNEESPWVEIGTSVENLANAYFFVTGSGKFIRNVSIDVEDSCALVKLDDKGKCYKILWGLKNGGTPTSEFPSHLMSHSVKVAQDPTYRLIMHAHPANMIALSFVLPLDDVTFTRELWEMATECPVVFPNGVGVIPWRVPGSVAIGEETSIQMKEHDVVLWAHHGVFCAGPSFDITFGLMDTVEKSAEILVKVLSMGGKRQTITTDNFKELAPAFHITLPEKYIK